MRLRYKMLLLFNSLLIVLFILIGACYVFYLYEHKNDGEVKTTNNLSINYSIKSHIKAKGLKEMTISVINDSEEETIYFIEIKDPKNCNNVNYVIQGDNDISLTGKLENYNQTLTDYITIKAGEIHKYKLTFNSNNRYTFDINISDESITTSFFSDVILSNNNYKEKTSTTIGREIAIENEGLIKSTDDYGNCYYFRGSSLNNNVVINDLKFKIVKINGDGTVKLVLNEKISDQKKFYSDDASYEFLNSDIYTFLNSWFAINLKEYSSLISNTKFCEDNTKNGDVYLAYNRILVDKNPSFMCLGNKVTSKVGLLTADEVLYAGATASEDNQKFYLYNSAYEAASYLMTPAKKDSLYYTFVLTKDGKVSADMAGTTALEVRPVININKNVYVTGKGTEDEPYYLTK